jgi:choline dehydrogenase-like flavoprotein
VKTLRESLTGFVDHAHPISQHHFQFDSLLPLYGTAHQCGTTRFGDDPKSSVLDRDCKAHELDNLYVVDTSFFVSANAVNPTLTAVANAMRVGDHLIDRLGASVTPAADVLAPTRELDPHKDGEALA